MERFPTENKSEAIPTKEGVAFVFHQHPELTAIGTEAEYSQYIETVFPGSKLRDVYYHGGNAKVTNFEKREGGIFFTKDPVYARQYAGDSEENITSVVLNSTQPRSAPRISRSLIAVDYKNAIERDGADAVIGEESLGIVTRAGKNFLARGTSTVVFDPSQIHILGSHDDIARFTAYKKT